MPENHDMSKNTEFEAGFGVLPLVEDVAGLTPKELEQERKAQMEEIKKRSWMADTAAQLASRIPVSVFAMGDLVCADTVEESAVAG